MAKSVGRKIVVSAVNIRKGGTLTILRDCLRYLSGKSQLSVTAIVHSKNLCFYEGIDYIEIPWSIKSWFHRLWCEYVFLDKISKRVGDVDLWLSLHDTTPWVRAKHQAVYCHTSYPFMKIRARDFLMDYKIPLFALFTKYAYKTNVHKNDYLIVQQEWFRRGLEKITRFDMDKIILAPPRMTSPQIANQEKASPPCFIYPSTPDCHKNFEVLLEAASLLEKKIGKGKFKVLITIAGNENRYAKWLYGRWGSLSSVDFHGFMAQEELFLSYGKSVCLVFPSRIETWGLPISEFKPTGQPMILSNQPYARESASGCEYVAFFNNESPKELASLMEDVLHSDFSHFSAVPDLSVEPPFANGWDELFNLLLKK